MGCKCVVNEAEAGLRASRSPANGIILDRMELIFEVRDAEEGGFWARALGHSIFTQGQTWEELRANALEAAALHFEDEAVQLRLIRAQ